MQVRNWVVRRAWFRVGKNQRRWGLGRAEITWAGDWTDRLVIIGRPVKQYVFVRCWVNGHLGCGRWSRVRGVVLMLSHLIVVAFWWFMYPIAACGFILELPGLGYLVLPKFDSFTLVYLVFAIFEPSLLMLGFPMYVSLFILVFRCGMCCGWW